MPLAVGNIVTVTLKDSIYFEKQGEVVEMQDDGDPDGSIGVKFGKEYGYLCHLDGDCVVVRFFETDLHQDADWSLEIRAERLYRNAWHHLYRLRESFDSKSRCKTEGCSETVTRRCLINIWGAVYEIDLCEVCAEKYNGMCGDSFPHKELAQVV